MYYLIRPNQPLLWTDISDSLMSKLAKDTGVKVADLHWDNVDWQPAERRNDVHTLRFALRYGIPLNAGIAISAMDLEPLTTLEQVLSLKPAGRQRDLPNNDYMEHAMPGWTADGDKLDDDMEQSRIALIEEKKQEANDALSVEPQPELVAHWRSLRGLLPDPL